MPRPNVPIVKNHKRGEYEHIPIAILAGLALIAGAVYTAGSGHISGSAIAQNLENEWGHLGPQRAPYHLEAKPEKRRVVRLHVQGQGLLESGNEIAELIRPEPRPCIGSGAKHSISAEPGYVRCVALPST
jgi:hypothetical protein